jgi:putative transposase
MLDILVQVRRDANAAKRYFRRLLRGLQYIPRVIVTDKLRSYGVARRQLLPGVEHRQSRYLNNRAETSHRPTQRCELQMERFKSAEQAQDFLSAHAFIYGRFRQRRPPTCSPCLSCDPIGRFSKAGTREHASNAQHDLRGWTTRLHAAHA